MTASMLTALASLLLSAQAPVPPVPPGQAALAQCLGQFVAAEQQAGGPVADSLNALASACHQEERAYRTAYVAAATGRSMPFLDADSEAYRLALDLRIAHRTALITAATGCRRSVRR
jgi:hypothetical protein